MKFSRGLMPRFLTYLREKTTKHTLHVTPSSELPWFGRPHGLFFHIVFIPPWGNSVVYQVWLIRRAFHRPRELPRTRPWKKCGEIIWKKKQENSKRKLLPHSPPPSSRRQTEHAWHYSATPRPPPSRGRRLQAVLLLLMYAWYQAPGVHPGSRLVDITRYLVYCGRPVLRVALPFFSAAVSFWGQTTLIVTSFIPKPGLRSLKRG